jgi:hypothetical protein
MSIERGGKVKRCVVACVMAVALLAMQVSGQTAARTDKQVSGQTAAGNDKAVAAPARSGKLDAAVPQVIAYQGKLTDASGRPVNDGKYVMIFSLSKDTAANDIKWSGTQTVVTTGGLFNVLLRVPVDSMPRPDCFLGIRLLASSDASFAPQRVVSVPFAFQTDRLQGKDTFGFVNAGQANSITSAMIVDGQVQTPDIADTNVTLAKLQQAGADTNQAIVWNGSE